MTLPEAISSAITLRQRRLAIFPAELRGEPAWDILLDLAQCRFGRQRASITDVGKLAGLPSTTVLRWVCLLEEQGWIEREPDRFDRRRTWLRITDEGLNAVAACFGRGRPDAQITTKGPGGANNPVRAWS